MKIISVVGARPNFIKITPIIRAMQESNERLRTSDVELKTIHHLPVHTGQHYDYEMSKILIDDLNLPELNKPIKEAMKILENGGKKGNCPKFWDGRAAKRIMEIIAKRG